MKVIIGLGNPGKKYESTRHNLGRLVVSDLQKKIEFPDFKLKKKLKTSISEGRFNDEKIILAFPETFMNSSGEALKKLVSNFKLQASSITVVHDDIDIPLGEIRIVKNRGAAGHKGVQSIIDQIKTKDFIRFRIGILPKDKKPQSVDRFVLQKFTKKENEVIKKTIKKCIEVLDITLKEGLEKAMNEFNE